MDNRLIILVGLPGSGKSYFAEKLKSINPTKYEIVSQDIVGSRKETENIFSSLIKKKCCIILDMCSVKKDDRKFWLSMAFNPSNAVCIFFNASSDDCVNRVKGRVGHPTIKFNHGENIVKSFAKMLVAPTVSEGFKKVITINSFKESNELLVKLGYDKNNIQDHDIGLLKFPKTPHIFNHVDGRVFKKFRDDIVLDDYKDFINVTVTVEEKMDGANIGISIDKDYNVILQNRSHFINSSYSTQFKSIDDWVTTNSGDLYSIIRPGKDILYGEWLYAKHSINYTKLPDYFMAFDIFDKEKNKFLSREKFYERLDGTNIKPVRCITKGEFNNIYDYVKLLETQSDYYDGPIEGVVIRVDDIDYMKFKSKLVRTDFIQTDCFWTKGGIVRNKIRYD